MHRAVGQLHSHRLGHSNLAQHPLDLVRALAVGAQAFGDEAEVVVHPRDVGALECALAVDGHQDRDAQPRQRFGDIALLPGAHTAAEIVFHVAYWFDGVRRRLEGADAAGDDWPAVGSSPDWQELQRELERRHRALHAAVAALDDARLDDPVEGSDPTVRGMLLGLLQHNAYHAGQLALLAKAARGAKT